MKITLGDVVEIEGAKVVAVAGSEVSNNWLHKFGASFGRKIPLAILIHQSDQLRAYYMTGEEMPLVDLNALCPEAQRRMMAKGSQQN